MSNRERANRRDVAERASIAFGDLHELIRDRAQIQVAGQAVLADVEREFGEPTAARFAAGMAKYESELTERIRAYHEHPLAAQLIALADAQILLMDAERS